MAARRTRPFIGINADFVQPAKAAPFSRVPIEVRSEQQRLRRDDPPATYLSIAKIQRDTGWAHTYDMQTTLEDLYRYWQTNLAQGNGAQWPINEANARGEVQKFAS